MWSAIDTPQLRPVSVRRRWRKSWPASGDQELRRPWQVKPRNVHSLVAPTRLLASLISSFKVLLEKRPETGFAALARWAAFDPNQEVRAGAGNPGATSLQFFIQVV